MSEAVQGSKELVIERIFEAPRDQVWRAWTEPEQVMKWWGPKGYTCPVAKIDFRQGGKYLFSMRSPEGQDLWSTGTFHEIVPMERITATDCFADADGNIVPASHYGMGGDWPNELHITITFEDHEDGQTKLTLHHIGLPAGEMSDLTQAGWNESFDKLEASLKQ